MRVTTCSFTRYHMYNQAAELESRGMLERLITNYPKFQTRSHGVSDKNVETFLHNGVVHMLYRRLPRKLKDMLRGVVVKMLSNQFSRLVARKIPSSTDVFIGLTLYALDGIKKANELGAISIVDSGSIYLRYQQQVQDNERKKYGLSDGKKIERWALEKEDNEFDQADYIFLPSEFAKSTFIRAGIDEGKILVNPYGVDLSYFKPVDKKDDVFRVVYVGGITLMKGVHYLIKAFSDANIENSELVLVGNGWPNTDVITALDMMGVNMNKVYFKGARPYAELYKYYSNASVFVFPSLSDGYGLVVPQSLSCGTPAIVSSNAGSSDVIREGQNGYIVPVCDSDAIEEKLRYLNNNPDVLAEMKKKSIQSVQQGLKWSDYGDRLGHLLSDVSRRGKMKSNRRKIL